MAFILNQLLPMDLDEPEHTVHVEHPTSEEDKEAMRVKAEKVELFA